MPLPAFYVDLVAFDAGGGRLALGALSAPPLSLGDVFAQVVHYDPLLPQQFGLSHAVRLVLQ